MSGWVSTFLGRLKLNKGHAIFHFSLVELKVYTLRGQFLQHEFTHRVKVRAPGNKFTPRGKVIPLLSRRTVSLGDKVHPWGTNSPQGVSVRP
jgi:hypothetical protein